ncbi:MULTISPECIES: aspartate aminotransferase family protein [Streptomyces]|uniref:Aspartate aminotransferase family protein n=1 Tax=Streptomyces glycanivorans TaxID=3033808 RepID=A0ABY9JDI3_9ACTN|nr:MULTISPECIES: aspartate aminotransferase family protein [unclassified Streptomyces]WSQ78253.1 aspartate aminotransferase family protein [Streptomyces sp. NBC_01213]TXS09513.1 aspartate aminotransferase family protein [Streptomyces sp. wa22]WLQ64869.1 aspartate aminotransferase family protein [Streptomyces sp. Alt3]WSQ85625.1 aspartate aminotransferase family protein [Streptomyces sp. NBC_01212]WSR08284.1 aspartate aminotransferase family protein [Streptomyces sp. NBC_01208]
MNGVFPALGGTEGSRSWFERAQASLAGGISSSARLTSTGPHPYPLYMTSGSGARVRDVDGNEYIDYLVSYGSAVLGHASPLLTDALTDVLRTGTMFGTCNVPEVELAELICRMVPCAELVRFANSGSEAVQGAVRAARGYTGRSTILKFEGHYHGWSDTLAVSNRPTTAEAGPYGAPHAVPHSPGIPPGVVDDVVVRPWNDPAALRSALDAHPGLAAVICEPIVANNACTMPDTGFLDLLRQECTARGIVLIFDEVCTGFRTGPGGAQTLFGVIPDLAVYSKALGGGLPIAAFAGRREVMEPLASGRVKHGGTYNASPLCATAALVTLRALNDPAVTGRIDETGRRIMETVRRAAHDRGVPCAVQGVGAMFQVVFTPDGSPTRQYRDLLTADGGRYDAFRHELLKRGVHTNAYAMACWFVPAVVSDADLDATCRAVEDAFAVL